MRILNGYQKWKTEGRNIMKINNIVECVHCKSKNTRVIELQETSLHDDSFYEAMRNEFGDKSRVLSNSNSCIFKFICDDCKKYFSGLVTMNIDITNIITDVDTNKLSYLTIGDVKDMK